MQLYNFFKKQLCFLYTNWFVLLFCA